ELDIFRVEFAALGEGPRHGRDAQTDVPERLTHATDRLLDSPFGNVYVEQEHQVDIRVGEEFSATVTTDSDDGDAGRQNRLGSQEFRPQGGDQRIDRCGTRVDRNHARVQAMRMRLKFSTNGLHLVVVE